MTVDEALAMHDAYLHLCIAAHNCGMAQRNDDWPRRKAHFDVRDYCAAKMREMIAILGEQIEQPRGNSGAGGSFAIKDSDE